MWDVSVAVVVVKRSYASIRVQSRSLEKAQLQQYRGRHGHRHRGSHRGSHRCRQKGRYRCRHTGSNH